jgi:outer membrane lipoprotein-sorting protein
LKRGLFLLIAGVACAGFVHAQTDAPLPKAETILDGYVEATGGKAAYEKQKNTVATGTVEFSANGMKGTVAVYSDASDNFYMAMDLEGIGKIEQGVYNGQAWESSALQGTRLKEGAEKAEALREATYNEPLHWRELYTKAETVALEDVDGEQAYKVVLTPKEGKPETVYFSKKTGFLIKRTARMSHPMGEVPMEMTLSNYKDQGGIMMPKTMATKVMGQEFTITIDDVKVNTEIPKDRFEPPAEVKKLMEKPASK